MWSFAYFILDYFYPDSFSFPENSSPSVYRYLYFSYVTLTTLGYGDVAPLTNKAGSLVVLEAIIGQIYLVVIVAWLVGMHVSRRSK
jgi:voltage-gated potassium channel